ncbi:MAG: hypothetical protein QW528_03495 [Candidatus Micrarchaeaceae archaeon]
MNDGLNATLEVSPKNLKPFMSNEVQLTIRLDAPANAPRYWAEAIIEVPHMFSLQPGAEVERSRTLLGIIGGGGAAREKKIRIFTLNSIYPDTYKVRVTFFVYAEDGVIAERKEAFAEIECGDRNAEIL